MTARAANILDTLPTFDGPDAFGADLPECGRPQMENTDRGELPDDPDPRITTKVATRRLVELAMGDNAAAKLSALPTPGEALHIRMDGSFNGIDIVFAVLNLLDPATIRTLYLASLSFNRRVGERLLEAIDAGTVARCVFLSSAMFQGKEKWLVDWLAAELAKRGSRLITARNHCKLLLAETTDGRHVVMEGSHNLRTCSCFEQATFYEAPDLYRWHAEFIERMG